MMAYSEDTQASDRELFSRNWAFISPELQAALDGACVFAAGVGLTSAIAVLACRTGFGSFILADGDQVELSNLNRQAFFQRQIGVNKATATAELLRDIRPDVDVTTLPEYIEGVSYRAALDRATLIINSIDYDNPAIFSLARDARARNIPMLVPLNLGWGGSVMIFTADSMPFEEYLGLDPSRSPSGADVSTGLVTRVHESAQGGVPPYLIELLTDYQVNGAQWPCEPQLGPAASLTAAMVVRAATALVAHEPVRVAPEVFHIDLRALLEPAATAPGATTAINATADAADARDGEEQPVALAAASGAGPADAQADAGETNPALPTVQKARKMPKQHKSDDDFLTYLRSRQQHARYPALAAIASRGRDLLYLRNRATGLWVYAIRHDQLTADALAEFGEFRIDQYALAGLYDTSRIAQQGYRTDPSLAGQAGNTIHVLCGTQAGQVLSCCSIVPPRGPLYSEPAGWLIKRRRPLVLGDEERALFPAETDLFGRGVFESLPAIQNISIERIREIAHLIRNQAIKSPLTGIAVFELCYALTEALTNPRAGIDITLGSSGPEARNLMQLANIPLLYAPWAQVVVSETTPEEDFWAPPTMGEGYFWPYVIATSDLRAITPFRERLNNALASPAPTTRSALLDVSNQGKRSGLPRPAFALDAQIPLRWFVSPPYGPPIPPIEQP